MNSNFHDIQKSIDYIEEHLYEELMLNDIAKASSMSLSNFYRVFEKSVGLTVKNYIRFRRLSKAAIELRYTSNSIIDVSLKNGYSSQQAFSKAFKDHFGIAPGDYRRSKKPILLLEKKEILKDFIHKAAHESISEGMVDNLSVNIYIIYKPAHLWIAKANRENWEDFYDECDKRGIMRIVDELPSDMRYGGGVFKMNNDKERMITYGKEAPLDYKEAIPEICEVFKIPTSYYMVFNHPPYPIEDHGSVIHSVYKAISEFMPQDHGFEWSYEDKPTYNDDDSFGFTVMVPMTKISD